MSSKGNGGMRVGQAAGDSQCRGGTRGDQGQGQAARPSEGYGSSNRPSFNNYNFNHKGQGAGVCYYCKKPGHKQADCRLRKSENSAHVGMVMSMCKPVERVEFNVTQLPNDLSNSKPYRMPVKVFDRFRQESVTIPGFRDTGADVCVLVEGSVPVEYLTSENVNTVLNGLLGPEQLVPVYSMYVDCSQFQGRLNVAVVPSGTKLRDGAHLLIGNDYGKIMVEANVSAITRSQARRTQLTETQEGSSTGVVGGDQVAVEVTTAEHEYRGGE